MFRKYSYLVLSVKLLSIQDNSLGLLYNIIVTIEVYDTRLITVRLDRVIYRVYKYVINYLSEYVSSIYNSI